MSFAALDCDRLSLTLRLTTSGGREHLLERELRAALETQLAAALAPFATGRDDGQQLFIDQLFVDGAVGAAWDMDAIVRDLARRIATAVSAGIDGGTGLRFADRPEFIAAFLAALADGSAWARWCFSEFEGLKALSASNAIRSAILMEEEAGIAALARLTVDTSRRVLAAINRADSARILATFRARTVDGRAPIALLWRESRLLDAGLDDAPDRWLAALIACERAVAGSAGEVALMTMFDMRRLRDMARSAMPEDALGDSRLFREYLCQLALASGRPMEWLWHAADADLLIMNTDLAAQDCAASPVTSCWTSFGGAFFLFGTMARLDWFGRWADEAEPEDCRRLALAVVMQALAPGAERAFCDEALLIAIAVSDVEESLQSRQATFERMLRATNEPAPLARGDRCAFATGELAAALEVAAATLLAAFASRLPGLAGSSADYLRKNLLSLPASVKLAGDEVRVELGRAPLDVLLVLSGIKKSRFALPGQRQIVCTPETDA